MEDYDDVYVEGMDRDEYLDALESHYIDGNCDNGCSCPNGHPPCSYCVSGFGLDLEEFLELSIEWFDDQNKPSKPTSDPYADYDRAMKGLF